MLTYRAMDSFNYPLCPFTLSLEDALAAGQREPYAEIWDGNATYIGRFISGRWLPVFGPHDARVDVRVDAR